MATVSIQKRKRKSYNSYYVRYKDPVTRKTIHYKAFRRHREAIYAAHELRMMIDHGRLYEIPTKKYRLNLMTFENAAKRTIHAWDKRLKEGTMRPVTYDGYRVRLRLLEREFGKRMLWKISREDIEKYLAHLILSTDPL